MQPGVGHYGVFNGSRFRAEIAPRISDFVLTNNGASGRRGQSVEKRSAKLNGAVPAAETASVQTASTGPSAVNE
jgi:poly(3-hydroxybutyrate) depolymerase